MNKRHFLTMARALLREHNLTNWTVRTDTVKTRAGVCLHHCKSIHVSRVIVRHYTDQTIRGVVLHEIAHALLPPEEQHGPQWEALNKELEGVVKVVKPRSRTVTKKTY